MTQGLSGPGLGLPLPQNLYPSEINGAPVDNPSNRVTLAAGDALMIPAGDWLIDTGSYSVLQYLDPVSNTWQMGPTAGWRGGSTFIKSDGFNIRVANLLGCPVSATITTSANGWVQSSTTITAVGGNSTWLPVIGGQLGSASVTSAGAGYGIAPIVLIPPPPPPANNSNGVGGVQASGYAVIASGTVSGFTFTNPGAGYPSIPTAVVVPSPYDPNLSTGITAATITFSLVAAGSLTAALCTNPGAPLASPTAVTLTIAGTGSNATLSANVLQTLTAVTVTGAGTGYGTLQALLTTVGGAPLTTGTITNGPDALGLSWRPRPAQVGLTVSAAANGTIAAQNGTIYDGGLFLTASAPNYVILTQPITATTQAYTGATLTLTMGSRPDIVTLQPGP